MDTRFSNEETVDRFIEECIKPYFPNSSWASRGTGLAPGNQKVSVIRELYYSETNDNYIGSKYSFEGEYKFLHYTTLKGLFGILNDRAIRMYNLSCMDDPHEILYASDHLGIKYNTELLAEYRRDGYYCLSMVDPIVEINEESLDMWRNYGDKGFGVAIEVEISKQDINNWSQYSLSRVYYGDDELSDLRVWWDGCQEFMEKENLRLEEVERIFQVVRGFHKRSVYAPEREMRLIYSLRGMHDNHIDYEIAQKKIEEKNIGFDIKGAGIITDYNTLHLERNHFDQLRVNRGYPLDELKPTYPNVKINKIIFGYNMARKDTGPMSERINEIFLRKFKNKCEFKDSPLRRYFRNDFNEEEFYGYN